MLSDAMMAKQHIVIVGAGAVGACTAYYLSQKAPRGLTVTVIEKTNVACAASGKAGGFLALDWTDASPIGPMARASFELHAQLAQKFDGPAKYGYRRLDTYSVIFQTSGKARRSNAGAAAAVDWIEHDAVRSVQRLGSPNTTAQVHPRLFTQTLVDAAVETGVVKLRCGTGVRHLLYDEDERVVGVALEDGDEVRADAVVICMGPWSGQLPMKGRPRTNRLPVDAARAHSIVMHPLESVPAEALFTAVLDGGQSYEPEVYPRPDGTVYMCGATDNEPLPESADKVQVDPQAVQQLEILRGMISTRLKGDILERQACYLPISRDGTPLIGAHPRHKQLYLATGHSCWGILNSPVTGLMMAELLLDGRISIVDNACVKAVDPAVRC